MENQKGLKRYLDEVAHEMDQMKILAGPGTKQEILTRTADQLEHKWGTSLAGIGHQEVREMIRAVAIEVAGVDIIER